MKSDWSQLEPFRERHGQFATNTGDRFGMFIVGLNGQDTVALCIVSDGTGSDAPGEIPAELLDWEHCSVHIRERSADRSSIIVLGRLRAKGPIGMRTPTWDEMQAIKRLFWGDEETCVQFHPKASEYVNTHPHVLHIWRRVGVDYQLPPKILVG